MFDFDREIQRRGTSCVKWDSNFIADDVKPMWVADMDFQAAPAIVKNLEKIVSRGVFGYQILSEEYYKAIINWFLKRHQFVIEKEDISYIPNVVMGLSFAVQAISEPGDEIIIQTPVYGPFFRVVEDNGRVLKENPMKNDHGYYTMDLEDFENKITEKTKAVILCNPHNPAGRVWKKEELKKLADLCVKHHLYILSDDIHSEIVFKGHEHTFIAQLSKEIADRTITFTSPSKAFNLASIHVANAVIKNKKIRQKYFEIVEKAHASNTNAFAEAALTGAYNGSGQWLDEVVEYLEENAAFFVNYIQSEIPQLSVIKPEGTYLAWVDFKDVKIENVHDFLAEKCKVEVNDGLFFGKEGKTYVRFNLACPRKTIVPVLEKIKEEVQKL